MKPRFLGTRGNIEARTRRHGMHSSMQVSTYDTEIVIDCSEDWLGHVQDWRVDGIVVTHAHPDHAFGLKEGARCPVFATEASWERMEAFGIEDRRRKGGTRDRPSGLSRAPFDPGACCRVPGNGGPCGGCLCPGRGLD